MITSWSRFYTIVVCSAILCCQCHSLMSKDDRVTFFVFGDSIVDAGNNNYIKTILQANFRPYGESFFKLPTGRFTDGRTFPDFICEYLKLPFIAPYLQPGNRDFTGGVNFASGGAGALDETALGLVINLSTQLRNLKTVEKKLRQKLGDLGTKAFLSKTIHFVSVAGNDYLVPFILNPTEFQFYSKTKKEYVSKVTGNLTSAIKEIYRSGGRKFVVVGGFPLDRLPVTRSESLDNAEALSELRVVVNLHNEALFNALKELQKELEGFKYIVLDSFNFLEERVVNPSNYGFKNSNDACCGSGLHRGLFVCGQLGYKLCDEASDYVFFDGIHPTEKIYKQFAELLWNGSSSLVRPYNLQTLINA